MKKITNLLVCTSLIVGYLGTPKIEAVSFPNPNELKQNIPESLLECYNSTFITTKDNLLPMTVNTLIAIIRKIENAIGTSTDVRTMSSALLTKFRFDGIQFKPELDPSGIQYAVVGNEYFLWKLIYDKILSKNEVYIPNETLTWIERCTLHRMLSMSVDPYSRGDNDEPCSKLDKYRTWNARFPRGIEKQSDVEMIPLDANAEKRIINDNPSDQEVAENYLQSPNDGYSNCPVENGVISNQIGGALSPGIVLAGIAAGSQPQRVPTNNMMFHGQPRTPGNLKRKNFPTNPNFNARAIPPNTGGNFFGRGNSFGGGNPSRGVGFGDGFDSAGDDPNPIPSDMDSKFGSTLAGEVAHVAVWMGPFQQGMQVGLNGGWNDTIIPKYYFQKQYYTQDALTDAQIRGSIDGLLLAVNMENWRNLVRGNLKLSQVLNMYYTTKGVFGTNVKSCKRRDYYDQIAPVNNLKDQTYAAAFVLQDLAPFQLSNLPSFTSHATDLLRNYIPTMNEQMCPNDNGIPKTAPVMDLHVVVDLNWDYKYLNHILQYIVDHLELWKFGGNFTMINGKDASIVIESSQSPLDLSQNFTYYPNGIGGFDFTKVLSSLKIRFQNKLDYDKRQNSAGGIPRIVIFMPYSPNTMSDTEKDSAKWRIQYFRENIPDVKFYYLLTSKNSFSDFADNPDKDVFVITPGSDLRSSMEPLVNRLTTTPRRIIAPNCGKYWSGSWYSEVSLNGYLDSNEIHFYRVHPNYFFRGANAKITISTEANSPVLTICNSRDNPLPIANLTSTGSVNCKQITSGNRHELYLSDTLCSSVYYASQCKPFYFSIANSQTSSQHISATCTDQECRDPDMAKYTIRHTGLSCYSSVPKLVMSIPVLLITLLIHFSKIV